jgi:hypothetical protein
MGIQIQNALIKSATIDTERCLSAWLHLDYGGSGQSFGGYVLYMPPWGDEGRDDYHRYLGNYTGVFIHRCIQIGGVETWEKLPGKTIRVRHEHPKVHAIGHIVKDDWFNPSEEFGRIEAMLKQATVSHTGRAA